MIMLARIENGAVAETRDIDMAAVPEHKRGVWRVVAGTQPNHDPRLETISGPTWEVSADAATRVWQVTRRPLAEQQAAVKAEAGRRIVERYPLHAQLNMQARATELLLVGPANWSEEETAEAAALQAARDWIKAVRAASNQIEALDPIPTDFDADSRWPA